MLQKLFGDLLEWCVEHRQELEGLRMVELRQLVVAFGGMVLEIKERENEGNQTEVIQ